MSLVIKTFIFILHR